LIAAGLVPPLFGLRLLGLFHDRGSRARSDALLRIHREWQG
jgi:hypothetical protein